MGHFAHVSCSLKPSPLVQQSVDSLFCQELLLFVFDVSRILEALHAYHRYNVMHPEYAAPLLRLLPQVQSMRWCSGPTKQSDLSVTCPAPSRGHVPFLKSLPSSMDDQSIDCARNPHLQPKGGNQCPSIHFNQPAHLLLPFILENKGESCTRRVAFLLFHKRLCWLLQLFE